jgi:cob(I)alamin adenosyltransferase
MYRFRIYTKTGDKGTASLYNGQRLPKDDDTFQALGDVDELNSAVGLAREYCTEEAELQQQVRLARGTAIHRSEGSASIQCAACRCCHQVQP